MYADTSISDAQSLLARAKVFDLSHSWFNGMPVAPVHPSYLFTLLRRHGDSPRADGSCTANELIVMSGHTGTHIDAIGHVSSDGVLAGGLNADDVQRGTAGLTALGAEHIPATVCPAVLLDIAGVHGVDCLPAGYEISPGDLQKAEASSGAELQPGSAALIRTGWPKHWPDADAFISSDTGTPGPGRAAAEWLVARDIALTGSDTLTYEVTGPAVHGRPVHKLLLVDRGVFIIEALNLEAMQQANVAQFLLVVAPLKLVGATASPVAPLAIWLPPDDLSRRDDLSLG